MDPTIGTAKAGRPHHQDACMNEFISCWIGEEETNAVITAMVMCLVVARAWMLRTIAVAKTAAQNFGSICRRRVCCRGRKKLEVKNKRRNTGSSIGLSSQHWRYQGEGLEGDEKGKV